MSHVGLRVRLIVGVLGALLAHGGWPRVAQAARGRAPADDLAAPLAAWAEPFEQLDPARWREMAVRGRTAYTAAMLDGRRCLRAESRQGASILLTPVRVDPHAFPRLSWDWRVDRLVEDEALDKKRGSDAAARVYVYFDSGRLPWQRRSLDYVWSASLPLGTILESAYSKASKIIVAESGGAFLGRWRRVERDLAADYQACFGEPPPAVIGIGVMTDTDDTRGEALAYFDEFLLGRNEPTSGRAAARY